MPIIPIIRSVVKKVQEVEVWSVAITTNGTKVTLCGYNATDDIFSVVEIPAASTASAVSLPKIGESIKVSVTFSGSNVTAGNATGCSYSDGVLTITADNASITFTEGQS